MPKYEAVILARIVPHKAMSSHKRVLKQMATHVLDKGGVVRKFQNFGQNVQLPYRMNKHQDIYETASIYAMTFDCGPQVLPSLKQQLSYDEDVLRATIVKLGQSIETVTGYKPLERLQ